MLHRNNSNPHVFLQRLRKFKKNNNNEKSANDTNNANLKRGVE